MPWVMVLVALAGELDGLAPADEGLFPFEEAQQEPLRFGFPCTGGQLSVCTRRDSNVVVSFALTNLGSPTVNPTGEGVRRTYRFEFPERTPSDVRIRLTERARPEGRDSHISMLSTILVFPRRGVPSMVERDGDLEVLLPTGEPVCFDATTHEVTGGVLRETGPIDTRKNRHRRRFAAVEYTGGGIWLRANQRGQSPEKARVWGRERRVGIEYDGEVCRVPRRRVWEQETGWFDLRFETDGAFFEFVEERCGWTLPEEWPQPPPDSPAGCPSQR